MEYHFEPINNSRHRDLIALFQSAFGNAPSLSAIAIKHETGYAGLRDQGVIAYGEDQRPAGFYGVFPVQVRIEGQAVLAAQSGDTMVHKLHEGRGLFTRLARATYDIARQNGVKGVFGFPSASSYPGFVKRLDWQHHENFNRYRFLVPTLPLSELSGRFRVIRPLVRRWQSLVLKCFSTGSFFAGSLMERGDDCVLRSKSYWAYKLASPNVAVVRVAGVDVILKLESDLGIGDIDTQDLKVLRSVMRKIKLFCLFAGINRISTYHSPGTPLDILLSNLSKPSAGLPIGYVNFSDDCSFRNVRFCYMDMDTF